LFSSGFEGTSHLLAARETGDDENALTESDPAGAWRKKASAVLAKEPLERTGHSYSGAGANAAGDLHISAAPLGMSLMRRCRQTEEPLHALKCQIPDPVAVLSTSHGYT